MQTFPFNIIVLDRERIPSSSLEKINDLLVRLNGTKLGYETYLVLGDYVTLVLNFFRLPGCANGEIKLYSLSAFDGQLDQSDGTHTKIRKQARSHLRFELGKLGLELPNTLKEEPK
jgi:hypothetical protein